MLIQRTTEACAHFTKRRKKARLKLCSCGLTAAQIDLPVHAGVCRDAHAVYRIAGKGSMSTLRVLLDPGASIFSVDYQGFWPLDWAAHGGNSAALWLLLSRGADRIVKEHRWGAVHINRRRCPIPTSLLHSAARGLRVRDADRAVGFPKEGSSFGLAEVLLRSGRPADGSKGRARQPLFRPAGAHYGGGCGDAAG